MALNLSTLTSPATSGEVLQEALTTADFLEPVPVLRNLARGSQKGGDAKQDVALNQPKALPLIDGDGYLYLSGVSGNNGIVPQALGMSNPWTIAIEAWVGDPVPLASSYTDYCILGSINSNISIRMRYTGSFEVALGGFTDGVNAFRSMSASALNLKALNTFNLSWDGTDTLTVIVNGTTVRTGTLSSPASFGEFRLGERGGSTKESLLGYYKSLVVTESGSEIVNCDFTATNVRHNDKKLKCATGQVVTINQAGNDPATVIKKSVLRFSDAASTALGGVLASNLTEGYYFAALSFLGSVGSAGNPRLFSVYNTGDTNADAIIFGLRSGASVTTGDLRSYKGGTGGGYLTTHTNMGTRDRGDVLHEVKYLDDGTGSGSVNNADNKSSNLNDGLNSNKFLIGRNANGVEAASFDLEFLALFPSSITDAQAADVVNYINNRNNVFDLKDGFGYYFYDAQKAPVGNISSGSSSWNGRIVGSDNGDTDKLATQGTSNDAPVGDGYVVTFADNSDHLDIPLTSQAGWQIVGTSLGTFAYRVNANAVTELNLLGNLGSTSFRKAGDLYGIILLPESATSADIESARKLLIDRGAADGTTTNNLYTAWYQRDDIVEFKHTDTSGVTSANDAWGLSDNLAIFPPLDLSSCGSFQRTWQNCSSLQSFPADAKLGTEANNVNFTYAWRSSGLTSFPALDLSNATNLQSTWRDCDDMLSFGLVDTSSVTNFSDTWLGCNSLTSFPSIDTSSGLYFYRTWYDLDSITDFPLLNVSAGRTFSEGWRFCAELVNFPAGLFDSWNPASISNNVFDFTWAGCSALSAQSVENILTSIDTSGQFATTNGASGGSALGDASIDIDYNVATGSLSAATNAAIDSLSGKGWEVFINGVLVIPNILDLAPAAAYSLRSFDADADPNVVNVRRSTGGTSDFTASEVSDGTLTDWVNTDVDLITPTLNNGGFEDGLTGWSTGGAVLDTSVAYAGSNSARFNIISGGYKELTVPNSLQIGNQYKVTFWAKVSDSSATVRADFGSGNLNPLNFSSTDWEYKEVTGVASGSTSFRFARDGGSPVADFTANFDNVTLTQLTADGHITTWYDQGGTNHATQSTASSQPKIVDAGTLVTEGGLAAIDFDGTDDSLLIPAGLISNLDTMLVSAVLTNSDESNDYGVVLGEPNNRIYVPYVSSSQLSIGYADSAVKLQDGAYSNGLQLITLSVDSSTASGFKNGQAFSSVATATASNNAPTVTSNANRIGSFGSLAGSFDFSEVVIFNNDQSANRTGIEAEIMDTYSIS